MRGASVHQHDEQELRRVRHTPLMFAHLHEVRGDRLLAQLLARFQAMQPFHEHEAFAVLPHQDWALQSNLQDALGDLLRLLRIERRAPL